MLCVSVLSFDTDSNRRSAWGSPKELLNNFHVCRKLRLPMRVEELNTLPPGTSNSDPLGLGLNGFLCMVMILFDNQVTSSEIPGFIIVIIALGHACIKLFKVNILIQDHVLPD